MTYEKLLKIRPYLEDLNKLDIDMISSIALDAGFVRYGGITGNWAGQSNNADLTHDTLFRFAAMVLGRHLTQQSIGQETPAIHTMVVGGPCRKCGKTAMQCKCR